MMTDTLGTTGLALGVIVKVTLVLGVSGFLATALGRASAAMRHLVWLLALGGSVAVVVLAPAAPPLRIRVPAQALGISQLARTERRIDVARSTPAPIVGTTVAPLPSTSNVDKRADRVVADARGLPTPSTAAAWSARLPLLSGIAWALGFVIVIARCVVAHRAVGRLVRSSTPVHGASWQRLVNDAAAQSGVSRRVSVVLSDVVGGPVTSGFVRALIILPVDAEGWTAERREVVLLHEMAHVARLDYVAQLVATAACALFWFHPAMWIAASRMRLEAELAADDRVLVAGLPGVRYATHLVDLARRASIGEPAAVAVGIAHRTHIERRVRAMLDTSRSRASISARRQGAAAVALLALLVPLAGLRTEAVAAATPNAASPTTTLLRLTPAVVHATARVTEPVTVAPLGTQRRDTTFERTLDARSGARLVLDLETGGAVTVHGWDEPRALLRVRLAGPNWRDTRVDFERVEAGVRLHSDFAGYRGTTRTNHEFELWVPRQSDIELSSAGGSLSIDDLDGRFSGHTGGGEIDIRGAKGRSTLSTGGGDVSVTASDLRGTVSTGGGSVVLSKVTGGLRGSSGSGPVVYGERAGQLMTRGADLRSSDTTADLSGITITSDRITAVNGRGTVTTTTDNNRTNSIGRSLDRGPLHITKAGGAISLDEVPDGATIHTGGGNIVVERAGGDLTATTGGGDVELRRVEGSASVSTGSGDVRITVVDDEDREHNIEARSGRGTIELVLPRSLDARVELETAYTEGFGRRTRIESDWTLERSESKEWESDNGETPRKFVRGTVVVGRGRGLIRINTVNGDIIVRRNK
jgi:beta-lactamase regulating signal transducer with metallopeptidase domain/DUF4097 and DUF4098 domain-containing protein YvlB